MKIYCLSGLGADKRVFRFLKLPDHELIHLEWLSPGPGETIPSYASRMMKSIDTSEEYAIMGLSFGGMVGVEIAKLIKPKRLILISSVKTRFQLPWLYRFAGNLKLNRLVPGQFLKGAHILNHYLFGAKTRDDRKTLDDILRSTEVHFINWAVEAVITWKNTEKVDCLWLHGTKDKLLPIRHTRDIDYLIKGGEHLMIIQRADEISSILTRELAN